MEMVKLSFLLHSHQTMEMGPVMNVQDKGFVNIKLGNVNVFKNLLIIQLWVLMHSEVLIIDLLQVMVSEVKEVEGTVDIPLYRCKCVAILLVLVMAIA